MINYKYYDIYIGIPNNLTINKDKFCFFTEVSIKKLDQFKSQNERKYSENKFVYINGLPIKDLNNKYYWHRFNDPRLDGLEPTKKLLDEFPNIKVISKDIINGLSLKNNLGYFPILKNNAKINLIVTQGEISEIFESLGTWKQNIVSIQFLGKSQEYIHKNNEVQSYLEFTGFQKSELENYQEFKYIKILPKNNNSLKNYNFVSDIKPANKNILNPRLNCLSKEADHALKIGNNNVYNAIMLIMQ